jgi:aryl-alcohol dehydrogenase-like predicted oxidoreductase
VTSGPTSTHHLHRRVGETDIDAFPLALGTAVFGWTVPSGRANDLLNRFVELGGNVIDTADSYSSGQAEQIIGTWMRTARTREKMTLATKVGRGAEYPGLSPRSIRLGVEASLERLQTDHVDVLYFHADDPTVPLEESLAAADELIQAGKVRYLAASNYSPERLIEARIASGSGLPRFEAVAAEYSLLRRDIVEGNTTMVALAQGIAIMPYFVLANGFLGRNRELTHSSPTDVRARRAASHAGRHGTAVLRTLDDIAMHHGVEISSVALAWVLARPGVSVCAVGAETISDLDALMHTPHLVLSRAETAELDKVSSEDHRARLHLNRRRH